MILQNDKTQTPRTGVKSNQTRVVLDTKSSNDPHHRVMLVRCESNLTTSVSTVNEHNLYATPHFGFISRPTTNSLGYCQLHLPEIARLSYGDCIIIVILVDN